MDLNQVIKRVKGLLKFHLVAFFNKKSISFTGLKQHLGNCARMSTSENGKIILGKGVFISECCTISAHLNGELIMGNNNFFNSNTVVMCLDRITIGDNNLFAQNVVVVDHNHNYDSLDMPICKQGYKFKPIHIGSDCWICANVVVCPGANIGDHIIVAANSVVVGALLAPGVYAGAPAKLIKKRG